MNDYGSGQWYPVRVVVTVFVHSHFDRMFSSVQFVEAVATVLLTGSLQVGCRVSYLKFLKYRC